jgi:hypothetical protein
MRGRARAKNMEKLRQEARYADALRALAAMEAKEGELPLA